MSEAIRNSMKDWVLEALPTRLNNPGGEKASTISLIQQRLHEEDSTGVLLEKNLGYEHLMLPMEYDPGRHCVTSVGEDWRTEDGELLFPERFPREVVDRDKQAMGPYACNTGEAPILMGDLSLKRIDEVSVGDEIMGWSKKEGGRTRIHRTTVEEVYKYRAKVVKITLDSGEVIRCTPDHKWWTQRYEKNRAEYIAANVGTPLARVCPSNIPHLTLEESRMAGWLAGFFDGEGSVSVCAKDGKGKYNPSYQIHFYQTAEQNLPICEKLEQALNMFKFDYTMNETPSRQNKIGASGRVGQKSRTYTLVNKQHSLGVAQKFINIVKPVKWVDRIQAMAEGSKFVKQWEKVISIEPDGEDDVYALTTGTGNYVVWGLASSNSASQFQQSPSPRGGGLIRRDQFMLYDDELAREQGKPDAGKYPDLDIIIASVDTAYTTKQENDASAITVWGIWQKGGASARSIISSYADNSNVFDMNGKRIQMVDERDTIPCAMLMYAKELRVPLHGDEVARLEGESPEAYRRRSESKWGLCEHLTDICKRFNVDTVLIEAKASGISVAQEMKRLNKLASWTVKLCNPGNLDKVARVYSIQPIFSNGQVYAPEKDWADKVISQCEVFPRGKHDDLVDTVSQALRYLRDNNFLARADEVGARVADEYNLAGSKRKQWIYDV
jgi:predicted phage terminase large subunit-like protein